MGGAGFVGLGAGRARLGGDRVVLHAALNRALGIVATVLADERVVLHADLDRAGLVGLSGEAGLFWEVTAVFFLPAWIVLCLLLPLV